MSFKQEDLEFVTADKIAKEKVEVIEPVENAVAVVERPVQVNIDKSLEEWEAYQIFTDKLLNKSDYVTIQGKPAKKKSAWRKYARAFNITTKIISNDIEKDEKGKVIEATFIVRASLPDGRYCEGWGNCSKFEGNKNKPNHDIPATAMTRATNRAISDLIGAGEVTAEELR